MLRITALLGLLLLSFNALAEQNKIYLLGAFNYKGTPITLAGLFYDPAVKDIETCKAYIRQLKGFHRFGTEPLVLYRTMEIPKRSGIYIFKHYSCIDNGVTASLWNERDFYRYTYLIDQRNGLNFTRYPNLDKCWAAIRTAPEKNTRQLFCAKINQRLQFD